jgi:menaquinone-dependent protoporphyrinogen oxidase
MKPVLVLYATRNGHTHRVAEYLSAALGAKDFPYDLKNAAHLPSEFSLTHYSAAIICSPVYLGRHAKEIITFVKRHLAGLERIPTTFISISLSAAGLDGSIGSPEPCAQARIDVERVVNTFIAKTGWRPSWIEPVAGALLYSKYNFMVRFIMKRIARKTGAPTDTSKDHEFTNWAELDHLVDEFAVTLASSGLIVNSRALKPSSARIRGNSPVLAVS